MQQFSNSISLSFHLPNAGRNALLFVRDFIILNLKFPYHLINRFSERRETFVENAEMAPQGATRIFNSTRKRGRSLNRARDFKYYLSTIARPNFKREIPRANKTKSNFDHPPPLPLINTRPSPLLLPRDFSDNPWKEEFADR